MRFYRVALNNQKKPFFSPQNGSLDIAFLLVLLKTIYMVTIKVNERTKAGKALIETARVMAQKYRGIDILEDDKDFLEKMKTNYQSDLLSEQEKEAFLKELEKLAE